jgi:hypothetical protein
VKIKLKFGPRKPNVKKRISARTTGRAKRALKSSVDPTYGKKGTGWIKDPKKAAYNKTYNKTTYSAVDDDIESTGCACGCIVVIIIVLWIFISMIF